MKYIPTLVEKIYTVTKFVLAGAVLLVLFQMPALSSNSQITPETQSLLSKTIAPTSITAGVVFSEKEVLPMEEMFFGYEAPKETTKTNINRQVDYVSSRKAYAASLAVVKKHEKIIKQKAYENRVPEDVALGVALLENGGSDTAVSSAGALGVFQLMPGTARSLGLKVDKKNDERRNTTKNIDAGVRYLRSNFDRFGDWGLATWAYHAGEGNVSKALKIYAKANHGVDLAGVSKPGEIKAYVQKYSITIHKLLSDSSVKKFTKKLNDDSQGYPYKVVATAALFKEASQALEVAER